MTRPGESLHHPVTGERIIWRKMAQETGGELLQGDLFVEPGGFVAAAHIHPNQEERFKVQAGTLRLRMGGEERILRPGEAAIIPAGTPHIWWNAGDDRLHVLGEFRPALRTEVFFETFFGLAQDGKTNRKGLPNALQLAVLAREYEAEVRLARPSLSVQRVILGPLAALGRMLGYPARYTSSQADPPARTR
jgi:quercetin dioxygenase-like cupin family protein